MTTTYNADGSTSRGWTCEGCGGTLLPVNDDAMCAQCVTLDEEVDAAVVNAGITTKQTLALHQLSQRFGSETSGIEVRLFVRLDDVLTDDDRRFEVHAIDVPCPTCPAGIDMYCTDDDWATESDVEHTDRRMAAAAVRILIRDGFGA